MNNHQLTQTEREFLLALLRRSMQEAAKQAREKEASRTPVTEIITDIVNTHGLTISPSLHTLWSNRLLAFTQEQAERMSVQNDQGKQPDHLAIKFSEGETLEVTTQMFASLLRQAVHEFEQNR